jgi:hypothetical protein
VPRRPRGFFAHQVSQKLPRICLCEMRKKEIFFPGIFLIRCQSTSRKFSSCLEITSYQFLNRIAVDDRDKNRSMELMICLALIC